MLLARCANPNLGVEMVYYAPEEFDAEAMHVVAESRGLSSAGPTKMPYRKLK